MLAICRRRSKRFARRRRAYKTLELARSFAPGPKSAVTDAGAEPGETATNE